MSNFLFVSIKPEYAKKIINGEKTIELRKSRPSVKAGDYILIYATLPIKALMGFGKITRVIECSPEDMWINYSGALGIDKTSFDLYYANSLRAIGIEISSICKFNINISLSSIRSLYPNFSPPQTFRYLSKYKALKIYKSIS